MNLNTFRALSEAYSAVYDDELRAEILSIDEDFSMIDDFSDEELIDVMEDIFRSNQFEIEECFDILAEATVSYGHDTISPEDRRTEAKVRLRGIKASKKLARIGRIKQAATNAVDRIKKAPSAARKYVSGKISSAREKLANTLRSTAQKVDTKPKATAEKKPSPYRGAGVGTRERASSGSYSAPSAPSKKPASGKIADPWENGKTPKAKTKKATVTSKGKNFGSSKNYSSSGEAAYQAAKSQVKEDINVYDIVLEYLLDEGYAESVEQAEVIMVNMSEEWRDDIMEKTAMAKRGLDEPTIRNTIAKNTGGGEAADRATALEKQPTYNSKTDQQRQNYARAQRGTYRKTNSSSPGLRGYGYQSSDPAVKATQAARGAQRGDAALTPKERKMLNR